MSSLSEFKNEPLADFTKPENKSAMEAALQKVQQELGRDYPLVGMYFDTSSVAAQLGETPDMKTEEARRTFYGMIREFYLHVPPEFRATVPLPQGYSG